MTSTPAASILGKAQRYRAEAAIGNHAACNEVLTELARELEADVKGRAHAYLASSLIAAVTELPDDASEDAREEATRQAMISTWSGMHRRERAALLNDGTASPREPPRARSVSEIDDPRPPAILSATDRDGVVLAEGEICLLAGEGGVGKSTLAGEIALAVALDAEDAGGLLAVHGGGPVLWLTFEEAPGELAARFKARNVHATSLDRVCVLDMRGGWPLFGPGDGRDGHSASYNARPGRLAGWDAMVTAAVHMEPRLIVVDPVLSAYVGEPNAAAPVREFLGALTALAREHSAGILALAHSSKDARGGGRNDRQPDPLNPGQVAGSTAWYDGVRGVLTFGYVPNPAGGSNRRLTVTKANMGPARIQCEATSIRAGSSNWIIGFEAVGTWCDSNCAGRPTRKSRGTGATDGSELD